MHDVTIRWDDPNLIEKGHTIYRSKTSMDINNMPEPIAELDVNATEFIDIDQPIGDTNYYIVSAWIDGHEVFSEELVIDVTGVRVYGFTTSSLYAIDVYSSEVVWDIPVPAIPTSCAYDANGNILVGFNNGIFHKYDPTGNLLINSSIGTSSNLLSISEMVNGDIVMGALNGRIYRYNPSTTNLISFSSRSGNYVFGLAAHKTENYYYVTSRNDGGAVEGYDNTNTSIFYKSYAATSQNGQGIDTAFNDDLVVHTTSGYGMHLHDSKTGVSIWGYNPSIMRDAHSVKFRKSDSYILSNVSQSGGASPNLLLITLDRTVILSTSVDVESGYYKVGFDIDGSIYNVAGGSLIKRNDANDIIWKKSISELRMVLTIQ